MIVRHRTPFGTARFEVARVATPRPPAFERSVDQLVSALADAPRSGARRRTPVVDSSWHDGRLRLTVDLPGVAADAIDVRVTDRVLTIAVSTDELSWERTLRLGASLDAEQVSARHVDGRLTVEVGPLATPEPRRIAIDTTPAPTTEPAPQLESGTSPGDGE